MDQTETLAPQVVYRGRGSLFGLLLRNLGLNIVTLGFYRFWGRTRLRRYLWSNIEVLGDPLAYTGTGMELFKGFLIALCVLAPYFIAVNLLTTLVAGNMLAVRLVSFSTSIVFLFLYQFAVYRARRYRLSRTMWRGIRCGQDGSAAGYAVQVICWMALIGLTLGVYYPWMRMNQQARLLRHTVVGDQRVEFDGRGRDLLGPWLIVMATLGLAYIWCRVREFRYVMAHTQVGEVRFDSALPFWPVFRRFVLAPILVLAGWFLFIFVVGFIVEMWMFVIGVNPRGFSKYYGFIGFISFFVLFSLLIWPLIYVPILRQICATLHIENPNGLSAIVQSTQAVPATGEGIADAFDVGLG